MLLNTKQSVLLTWTEGVFLNAWTPPSPLGKLKLKCPLLGATILSNRVWQSFFSYLWTSLPFIVIYLFLSCRQADTWSACGQKSCLGHLCIPISTYSRCSTDFMILRGRKALLPGTLTNLPFEVPLWLWRLRGMLCDVGLKEWGRF